MTEEKKKVAIDAKLGLNVFKVDKQPHIVLDQTKCKTCKDMFCLSICPANLYTLTPTGELAINFEGCLECGTCRIICEKCGISWKNPRGGFGVQLRFG
jgi:ferredoxin like protein